MYNIFRSGQPLPVPEFIDRAVGGGRFEVRCVRGGAVDTQTAYPYPLYFSDQFSCTKFFDPVYGLFYINLISLIHFNSFKSINKFFY